MPRTHMHRPTGSPLRLLSKGATTSQSSTRTAGGESSRAVDGNTDGAFASNSCTHTNTEPNPWWMVDLAAAYAIDKVVATSPHTPSSQLQHRTTGASWQVVLYNRQDCCSERLNNAVRTSTVRAQ